MGAIVSVLSVAAIARTIVAVARHAAKGDFRGIVSDVLLVSPIGKFVGMASRPLKLASKALDEGSMLHKGLVLAGKVTVPVVSRIGHGVWGMLRSAAMTKP